MMIITHLLPLLLPVLTPHERKEGVHREEEGMILFLDIKSKDETRVMGKKLKRRHRLMSSPDNKVKPTQQTMNGDAFERS